VINQEFFEIHLLQVSESVMDNFVAQTIKKTVVILGNSPIHRLKKLKAKIQEW